MAVGFAELLDQREHFVPDLMKQRLIKNLLVLCIATIGPELGEFRLIQEGNGFADEIRC